MPQPAVRHHPCHRLTGLRDAGLTPGHDLGVAGFDDIGAAVDVTPALTSVAIPLHDLGHRALRVALDDSPPDLVPIHTEVVLRASTSPRPT